VRRAFLLAVLCGCSKGPQPDPVRTRIARIEQLLDVLNRQDGEGNHGPYHKIDAAAEKEFWPLVSELPVVAGGDWVLLRAMDEVYTRYDDNYWNGYLFHYPYLSSRKTVALADKLLKDYPDSPHAERALWLKAFALRILPPEGDEGYERDMPVFAEQVKHRPDAKAARATLEDLVRRFPEGRHAKAAKAWLSKEDLSLRLLDWPKSGDPRGQ
jgi:hypothetical protein